MNNIPSRKGAVVSMTVLQGKETMWSVGSKIRGNGHWAGVGWKAFYNGPSFFTYFIAMNKRLLHLHAVPCLKSTPSPPYISTFHNKQFSNESTKILTQGIVLLHRPKQVTRKSNMYRTIINLTLTKNGIW